METDRKRFFVDGKAPSYNMLRVRVIHQCSRCGIHRKLVGSLSPAPIEPDANVGGYWVLDNSIVSCKGHDWVGVRQ